MTNERERRIQRILIGVIVFLLSFILLTSVLYVRSTRPMRQAKEEATTIAKKYAKLETVDRFYWFNRQDTYFSLLGKNDKDQAIAVIIPETGEKVTILDQKEGLSEDEIRELAFQEYQPDKILKVELGLEDQKPVWEVTLRREGALSYILLDFKDGKEVKVIQDI